MNFNIETLDFTKVNGLIPAVIQDERHKEVLMLGYMNQEAVQKTLDTGLVTFYSRSKQRLWTKGETSGNTLKLVSIEQDCDNDTLLVRVLPAGPVCHTGTDTCFGNTDAKGFLHQLAWLIEERKKNPGETSYTNRLLNKGINKVAQKVGEEAVELVIEAKDDNEELFLNEAADLMYHTLVLLAAKGHSLEDVEKVLKERNR